MSVVCERCGTSNRDNAMFCIGCAGRLPAFQPSARNASEPASVTRVTKRPVSTSRSSAASRKRPVMISVLATAEDR